MRLGHSPLDYLRRHAWLLGIVLAMIVAYVVGIGWAARQLRSDLAHTIQLSPAVADHQHSRE